MSQRWLESQTVELGQTRKLLLRLTKQAKESLGIDSSLPEYGSLVHEYWKRFFGHKFEDKGYKIDFEVPRLSGRVSKVKSGIVSSKTRRPLLKHLLNLRPKQP